MKKILYTTAVALTTVFVAASCKNDGRIASGSMQTLPVSATEYQEFREWKQQQLQNSMPNMVSNTTQAPAQQTKVVHHYHERVVEKPAPAVAVNRPVKKKGWSKAAKGTAIGAGAGAAAGAILVKKNRALGAVIGGVLGGGVGYGIGRSQDKKDGRY